MSQTDSHDDPPPDSGPALSREAVTPRGGFMARPGLKPPPRHAVVVRGGDVPVEGAIPVARSSFPPPPLHEIAPLSMSEKVTLRAIPAARVPRIASVVFEDDTTSSVGSLPPPSLAPFESLPPPSDAPLVQSVPPVSAASRARRKSPPWTVFVAGAAGLLLGLISVLAARGGDETQPEDQASPAFVAAGPSPAAPEVASAASSASHRAPALADSPAAPSASPPASSKPSVVPFKRSIF